MRTLEGGLRIDVEDAGDWQILGGVVRDALSCDDSLAGRLGGLITDEEVAPDWREYIVPDLEAAFMADLAHVAAAVESVRLEAGGGAGPVWIASGDAMRWYGALNQARLALEERFHFGPAERLDPAGLPPSAQAAFLRSQFYCALQSVLLELAMR